MTPGGKKQKMLVLGQPCVPLLRDTGEEEEKNGRRKAEKKEVSLRETYAFFMTLCSAVN